MAAASSAIDGKIAPGKAPNAAANGASFSKEEETDRLSQYVCSSAASRKKAGQMYGMGLIGGFCHLYIGQEAVVTGVKMAAAEGDQNHYQFTRDHGHMLACGMDPKGRHGGG